MAQSIKIFNNQTYWCEKITGSKTFAIETKKSFKEMGFNARVCKIKESCDDMFYSYGIFVSHDNKPFLINK